MAIERKVGLVQSFSGAVILTLLTIPMGLLGFGEFLWMLFLPLLLFFALKAQFKLIPSMLVCYICGIAWAFIIGMFQNIFAAFAPQLIIETVPIIICIFLILTIHENLLAKTIFGNVPTLFLGMSTTLFVFLMDVNITPFHLIGFFIYGIILCVALVKGGSIICGLVFGKETLQKVFAEKAQANF